jgi:hypothetical protein
VAAGHGPGCVRRRRSRSWTSTDDARRQRRYPAAGISARSRRTIVPGRASCGQPRWRQMAGGPDGPGARAVTTAR